MLGSYQGGFGRAQVGNNMVRAPMNMASLMTGVGMGAGNFRARGRTPAAAPPRAPMIRGVMVRHTTPVQVTQCKFINTLNFQIITRS